MPPGSKFTASTSRVGAAAPEEDNSEGAQLKRKVLALHVLLLRIALRLKQNPRSSIVQQVVYRWGAPSCNAQKVA